MCVNSIHLCDFISNTFIIVTFMRIVMHCKPLTTSAELHKRYSEIQEVCKWHLRAFTHNYIPRSPAAPVTSIPPVPPVTSISTSIPACNPSKAHSEVKNTKLSSQQASQLLRCPWSSPQQTCPKLGLGPVLCQ